MTEMFFQVLFIVVICLGIFLFASWFFSCLYTEWQLDAAERARKKQEEELQVVKEQDPDGTEETNFIEETSIAIDDQPDKNIKKQSYNVQMSDATLPSNQVLCSVYSQANDSTNNSKKKKTINQKQQQQFANLTLQDIQVLQLKQQQAVQQRQIEQIKQQYPDLTPADIRRLKQMQHAQQLQANLTSMNNLNNLNSLNSTSNSVAINLSNNVTNNKPASVVNNSNSNQQATVAVEMPATVEIVVEPEKANPINNKVQQNDQQQNTIETIVVEVEKNIIPETVPQTQSQQSTTISPNNQQQSSSNQQPIVSVISEEEIIKELNLQDKLPYRERKLEEYEFFKTALEIIDLSHNSGLDESTDTYAIQFENAINEADAKKSKINWQQVPLLHATDHITAIEELAVLLDQFLKSKFFKRIGRSDKIKVIDQLLRSVLNIITKRIKYPAKKQDHQEDLLWIWNEIKESLENEKIRINRPKSSNQNVNKPTPPPKPHHLI